MYCYQCHYNLEHLTRENCPECGRGFDPGDPQTYSERPIRALPLIGRSASAAVANWAARNRMLSILLLFAMQFGIRALGCGFLTIMLLIAMVEGASGRSRTNWENVIVTGVLILIGFYLSHVFIPLMGRGGRRGSTRP